MASLYRFVDVYYAPSVGELARGDGTVSISLLEFAAVARTPKGVWIKAEPNDVRPGELQQVGCGRVRFVLLTARRRFACETVDEAAESFLARKRAQIRILRTQMRGAERAIAAMTRRLEEAR